MPTTRRVRRSDGNGNGNGGGLQRRQLAGESSEAAWHRLMEESPAFRMAVLIAGRAKLLEQHGQHEGAIEGYLLAADLFEDVGERGSQVMADRYRRDARRLSERSSRDSPSRSRGGERDRTDPQDRRFERLRRKAAEAGYNIGLVAREGRPAPMDEAMRLMFAALEWYGRPGQDLIRQEIQRGVDKAAAEPRRNR